MALHAAEGSSCWGGAGHLRRGAGSGHRRIKGHENDVFGAINGKGINFWSEPRLTKALVTLRAGLERHPALTPALRLTVSIFKMKLHILGDVRRSTRGARQKRATFWHTQAPKLGCSELTIRRRCTKNGECAQHSKQSTHTAGPRAPAHSSSTNTRQNTTEHNKPHSASHTRRSIGGACGGHTHVPPREPSHHACAASP